MKQRYSLTSLTSHHMMVLQLEAPIEDNSDEQVSYLLNAINMVFNLIYHKNYFQFPVLFYKEWGHANLNDEWDGKIGVTLLVSLPSGTPPVVENKWSDWPASQLECFHKYHNILNSHNPFTPTYI